MSEKASACRYYVRLPNGTTWPNPAGTIETEDILRYAVEPSMAARLTAASVLAAYRHLFEMSQRDRNAAIEAIKEAVEAAEKETT